MHPAYSVIFFTTSSGAGYGLLFWLSLAEVAAPTLIGRWVAFAALVVALALITAGLLASTFHLGHPERAIGAFSQWRSSWLSREGVAAVATYVPSGLMGLLLLFGFGEELLPVLAGLAAIGALVTVYSTGKIYGTLRTIRQWYRPDVTWIYLALAGATGGLLFALFASVAGTNALPSTVALATLLLAALLKLRYWSEIDEDPGRYTAEQALGVPGIENVRPLDPPHTMPNFVMREMGYSVARRHAVKLRRIATYGLFVVPIVLIALGYLSGWTVAALVIATLSAALGVATERWLFFAEAEHVSQLYYGRSKA